MGAIGWDFDTPWDQHSAGDDRREQRVPTAYGSRPAGVAAPAAEADAVPEATATTVLPVVTAAAPPVAPETPATGVARRPGGASAPRHAKTGKGRAESEATALDGPSPTGAGAVSTPAAVAGPGSTVHERIQAEPEFAELRRRQRLFVFPATAAFLLWYLTYVLLACYAPDVMAVRVADGINLGLVLGLLQFVSTFAVSTAYVVYARHRLDPLAERLRARVDGGGDDPAGELTTGLRLFGDTGSAR